MRVFLAITTVAIVLVYGVSSCTDTRGQSGYDNSHAATSSLFGKTIWADPLNCSQIMQADSGYAGFYCFRIGLTDSSAMKITDEKIKQEIDKYWQYDMWQDWMMLVGGDTIRPVFHEPATSLNVVEKKAVLVFETEVMRAVDTLLFTDRRNGNFVHHLIINRN